MSNTILFDFSNLAHRCIHLKQVNAASPTPAWGLWHYMTFNAMYEFVLQTAADFEGTYTVVLALDSTNGYWRKELYPPYKADRAKRREADGIDWQGAYREFERLVQTVRDHLPWEVLRIPGCEADDVIAVLADARKADGLVFVHSGDSDYVQLIEERVRVYSPMHEAFAEFPGVHRIAGTQVWCQNQEEYLRFAILTGQGGKDNVYNVLTPTDWPEGKRKPGFGVVAARKCLSHPDGLTICLEEKGLTAAYQRNKTLIDLREIPRPYREAILHAHEEYALPDLDIDGFLAQHKWPSMASETVRGDMRAVLGAVSGIVPLPDERNTGSGTEDAFAFSL